MCDNALPVWRGEGTIQDEIGGGEGQSAPRGRSMKKKSTQSRGGVKRGFPLAGSRGGAPCGVWGNAPTVSRATSMPNALNKGAGSEASLPVTLRSRRSAPNLLSQQLAYCRAHWRDRPASGEEFFSLCWSFSLQGDFASAEATRGQWKQTKSAVAPLTPSGCTLPYSIFIGRLYSYCSTIFSLTFISTQGDNHHVRIYRRSCVRKNDQFLSS